jgi:rubrerythrin
MLLGMATMEDGHEKGFKEMRTELTDADKEQITFDPQGEAELYLQTMADSHGTEGKKSIDAELTGKETIEEILEIAVNAEKDSIIFYLSMKKLVPSQAGKDKVDDIIAEEIGHITILGNQLALLG